MAVIGFASIGWFGWGVRSGAEKLLQQLGTDHLDVYLLGWLGTGSAWTDATQKELLHLRESGKVRAIGVSIHDRLRAGKLAPDSPLDLLMLRYNAAHPSTRWRRVRSRKTRRSGCARSGVRSTAERPFPEPLTSPVSGRLLRGKSFVCQHASGFQSSSRGAGRVV